MVFSSLNFICLFLPVVILLHWLVPARWKNAVLLAGSLCFYAFGEIRYIILLLLSISLNYFAGLHMACCKERRRRRLILTFAISVNLLLLGYYKYSGFLASIFGVRHGNLILPLGISFYTFQGLSYLIDVYRRKVQAQGSWVNYALYISMFPQLVAGPIVKYSEIAQQLGRRTVTADSFGRGIERFILGLSKKVLLANALGEAVAFAQSGSVSVLTAWLSTGMYTLQIYFDFSGYSDMAIGMGSMLGFRFPENFDHPYIAKSVTDFWRRWHMTLSSWFRDYVYIPLGGNRVRVSRHIVNLLVVWGLTGLWHGASWNFVLWGLYYALILIAEKYLLSEWLGKVRPAIAHLYTMILVMLGWVLFSADGPGSAFRGRGALIGIGARGFADASFIYQLRSHLVLLIVSAACCVPGLHRQLVRGSGRVPVLYAVLMTGLFVLCVAALVWGGYNPFLYFRF